MSSCIDKKYENMIHAYETGILSDQDEKEFQLHLMDCDSCFDAVKNFQNESALISSDNDFKNIADCYRSDSKDIEKESAQPAYIKYLRYSMVAAALFLVLILKPWDIRIDTTQELVASENNLLILSFNNLENGDDPKQLGEISSNLLITDLSNSRYLKVISPQRVYDVMKKLNSEGDKIDNNLAQKISKETNARWMITGSILKTEPNYIVTTQISDVTTGEIISTEKIIGEDSQDIFEIVDKLTVAIKQGLDLPAEAVNETDLSVAEVTTSSEDAYRYYLEGVKEYRKFYRVKAKEYLRLAVEHDSTFAMAYYYLSKVEADSLINMAVRYSEHASKREQQLIMSSKAASDGDYEKSEMILENMLVDNPSDKEVLLLLSIRYYNNNNYIEALSVMQKILKLDPTNEQSYNMMAYCYSMMGDFEMAITTINNYIALKPDQANPYDSRADLYAYFGDLDGAIESYETALKINPKFYNPLYMLGYMYLFKDEYEKADSCFTHLKDIDSASAATSAPLIRSYIPLRQGKFKRTFEMTESAIQEYYKLDNLPVNLAFLYSYRASLFEIKKEYDSALIELEKAINFYKTAYPQSVITFRNYKVDLLGKSGQLSQSVALTEELSEYKERGSRAVFAYWYSKGAVALHSNEFDDAIQSFKKSISPYNKKNVQNYYIGKYMLARAYHQNGQLSEAVEVYEELLKNYGSYRMFWSGRDILIHYYLGLAYEQSNWNDKAAEQYAIFLEHWGNVDIDLEEVQDARKRYARLVS